MEGADALLRGSFNVHKEKMMGDWKPDVDTWEQESRIAGKICTVLWNTTLTANQIDEVMKALMAAGVTFKGEDDDK